MFSLSGIKEGILSLSISASEIIFYTLGS